MLCTTWPSRCPSRSSPTSWASPGRQPRSVRHSCTKGSACTTGKRRSSRPAPSACSAASRRPSARRYPRSSSREVSVAYFTVLLIGYLLWIAYGVAAVNRPARSPCGPLSSCSQGAREDGDPVVSAGLGEDRFEMVLDRVPGQGHLPRHRPGGAAGGFQTSALLLAR